MACRACTNANAPRPGGPVPTRASAPCASARACCCRCCCCWATYAVHHAAARQVLPGVTWRRPASAPSRGRGRGPGPGGQSRGHQGVARLGSSWPGPARGLRLGRRRRLGRRQGSAGVARRARAGSRESESVGTGPAKERLCGSGSGKEPARSAGVGAAQRRRAAAAPAASPGRAAAAERRSVRCLGEWPATQAA